MSVLEKEAKCIFECIESTKVSFGSQVKPYLIKSNPLKYQPITQAINLNLSILKKHFSGIVPPELEYQSASFQFIIAEHNEKYKLKDISIGSKLKTKISTLVTHNSPQKKTVS